MKKKKRNNKQKMLLNIKTNKDLNWNDVEAITGYTRQNIDHAFKNGTQKTIDKVLAILESVWFFYAYSVKELLLSHKNNQLEKVKVLEQVSLFWFFKICHIITPRPYFSGLLMFRISTRRFDSFGGYQKKLKRYIW